PVRELLTAVLAREGDVVVLATSRERLGLAREQICRVAPLPLPAPGQQDRLHDVPSVAVFVERARRARPDFTPNDDELEAIASVVRRLDGLPLALELAAGWLSSLSVGDLVRRLDRALDVLAGGADGHRHHSILRAVLAWSYELLSEEYKRLFR